LKTYVEYNCDYLNGKAKNPRWLAVFILVTFFLLACSDSTDTPVATKPVAEAGMEVIEFPDESIFTDGKIYTVDSKQPWAEAVIVREGEIVYVGDSAGLEDFAGADTKETDLGSPNDTRKKAVYYAANLVEL
jgi:hypothetical protein